MPHEVPLTVSEPELVVTLVPLILMPQAWYAVLFAAVPVIITLPAPVAEMADELRETPGEDAPSAKEVPLIVSKPELVVTLDESTSMPEAKFVPLVPTLPVIVRLPLLVEMLADD